jgi:nitrogen PTS system EIIA component
MRITEIITRDLIKTDLISSDKDGLFAEMVDFFCAHYPDFDREILLEYLNNREFKGSTNLGDGLAIPHGKIPGVATTYGAIGISGIGLDYLDCSAPVHIVFMLFSEEDPGGIHLRVLGAIACLMKDPEIRANLIAASTPDEAFAVLLHGEDSLGLADNGL